MWSRPIVPTLAMLLLSYEDEYHSDEHTGEKQGFFRRYQQKFEHAFETFREGYRNALQLALESSTMFVALFLGFCLLSTTLVFVLGGGFFPKGGRGQAPLHMRARPGLRIEEPARLADQVNQTIRQIIPQNELET